MAKIQKLNASGAVYKTNSNGYSFNIIANRFWTTGNDTNLTILDFSGADVEFIRENQGGNLIGSAKINSISLDGLIVTQPDSLLTPLSVELVKNGVVTKFYSATEWAEISRSNIPDLEMGDVLNFKLTTGQFLLGFEDMILAESSSFGVAKRSVKQGAEWSAVNEVSMTVYPNPFNPTTMIKIVLPKTEYEVKLDVYNLLGQLVIRYVDGKLEAGEHIYRFDGANLASGHYIYRLTVGEKVQSGKLLLMK